MSGRKITGEIFLFRSETEIEWKIANFLSFSKKTDELYSPVFHFMDSLWYLTIYPYGSEETDIWISLYLTREDLGPPKSVEFTLEIKDLSETFETKERGVYIFEESKGWGYSKFFMRSQLVERKSTLMPSGILTIRCCLKNGDSKPIPVRPLPMKLTEVDTLSEDLGKLLEKDANYDVTLKVQNKEFRAHRSILAARSEVLSSMFQHEMSESKTGVVNIADCDPDSFEHFLRYLYTGKAEDVTSDKALHLYEIADKYAVLKLKSFCVEFMLRHLSVDNVCAVAILAQRHDEDELLALVQTFFIGNFARVLSTDSWEKLLRKDSRLANDMLKGLASKIKIQD